MSYLQLWCVSLYSFDTKSEFWQFRPLRHLIWVMTSPGSHMAAKIVMSGQFRNLAMFPLRVCLWLSVSIGQCRLPSHCWGKGSFPVKVNLETFLSCPRSEDEKNLNTDNNRRIHLSFWILQALHKPCKRKKSWRISVFLSAVQDRQGRLMSCCLPFVEWKEVDQSGLSSTNLS